MISVENVSFVWSYRGGRTTALDKVSCIFDDNDKIHFICGPSGSGKSTLALAISGLIRPGAGSIVINGKQLSGISPDSAYVFQFPENLFMSDSLSEEFESLGSHAELAKQLAADLNIDWEKYKDTVPQFLPDGIGRLAAIALQAAREPHILILDEPTVGLDFWHRARLTKFLHKRLDNECETIIITHDLRLMRDLGGRTLLMKSGRAEWQGLTGDLLANSGLMKQYALL
jgi:energy-coupling factor transport system ATP-binding protein